MSAHSKSFVKLKNIVLFIFDFRCCICKKFDLELDLHHIDKNHKNNSVFNLMPLCKSCHKLAHKNCSNFVIYYTERQVSFLNHLSNLMSKSY